MANLADNVARVIKVFDTLKAKVTNYIGIGSGNVSIPGSNIDTNHNISIETYVNAIDEVHAYGVEEGRQAQYDEFWDEFQQNGKRTDYRFAFGCGWNAKTFKPKYPITPKDAYQWQCAANQMFSYIGQSENKYIDLSGYPLDFTKVTQVDEAFHNAFLENIYVDVTDIKTYRLFNGSNMDSGSHPYKNVTIKCSANTTFSNSFWYANFDKLLFTEDSVIAQSVDFHWGVSMIKESFISIMNTLSSTTTNLTVTFNKTAVNTAFGINVDDETTYTDEWKELMASKSNWNIAFA